MHTEDEWLKRRDEATARGARLIDLHAVVLWVHGQMGRWATQGLRAELQPPTSARDKNSMWVDLEGPSILARVVIWDSGEWEVQRGDPESGLVEVSPYHPAPSLDTLIASVEAELLRMHIVPER